MIKLKKLLGEGEDKQSPKQTLSNEARRHFLEIISTYGSFGPKLKNENDLAQIAETLGAITDAASEFANKEAGNHFDEATVKRNMNELGKLSAQFEKIANEAKSLHSQMENLYEDMGHIIGRYYGVSELSEEEVNQRLGIRNEKLVGNQHKLDVDKDGDIGSDDLADLRAGKETDENINEYDEWSNTRIQAKNIFRMLKQKYSNSVPEMKKGLELIIKQNHTKQDQADVMRDEFNKFFKISK
jgi:lysozyme family protein